MTDIQFDEVTRDWAVWVNGDLQGYRATCAEALELLDEATARYERQGLIRKSRAVEYIALPMAA